MESSHCLENQEHCLENLEEMVTGLAWDMQKVLLAWGISSEGQQVHNNGPIVPELEHSEEVDSDVNTVDKWRNLEIPLFKGGDHVYSWV